MTKHRHATRFNPSWGERNWNRRTHRAPRLLLAIAALFLLGMAMAHDGPGLRAAEPVEPVAPVEISYTPRLEQIGGQNYFDGLTVREGQTLSSDVVVWQGDATVESGGIIGGSLVVYQGDVFIEEGGQVLADVTAWTGDVVVDGRVAGSISAVSGDIELGRTADVGGDVSALGGDIDREGTANVAGNIVRGPDFPKNFFNQEGAPFFRGRGPTGAVEAPAAPEAPDAPEAPAAPNASFARTETSFAGQLLRLFGRLVGAAFRTLFVMLAAMVVYALRPTTVQEVQARAESNPTRAFALGISVNMTLWLIVFLFGRAFCLAILAVVPALLLIFVNAVGFTAVARIVGKRLGGSLRSMEQRPVMEVALGALLLAAIFNFLSALFGGQSGIFFGLLALFVTAPGVGAFVEPWLERYRARRNQPPTAPGRAAGVPAPPAPPAAPTRPSTPPAPQTQPAQPVRTTVPGAAPQASTATPLAAVETPAAATPGTLPPVDLSAEPAQAAPVDSGFAFELPEQSRPATADAGITIEDVVAVADAEQQAAAERARLAREQALAAAVDGDGDGDDFTRIVGVGRSSDRKLKAAGITRFAQLAALPVEMIASILGVAREEVIEDEIVQQAGRLSQ